MSEILQKPQTAPSAIQEDFRERVIRYTEMSGEQPCSYVIQDQKLFVTSATYQIINAPKDLTRASHIEFNRFLQVTEYAELDTDDEHGFSIAMHGAGFPHHIDLRSDPTKNAENSFWTPTDAGHVRLRDETYAESFVEIIDYFEPEGNLELIPSQMS